MTAGALHEASHMTLANERQELPGVQTGEAAFKHNNTRFTDMELSAEQSSSTDAPGNGQVVLTI